MKIRQRDIDILEKIKQIKAEHPEWGYRRVCAYLRLKGERINHKRIYRIMKVSGLLVERKRRNCKPYRQVRMKIRPNRAYELWGIDMTKIYTLEDGWCYVEVVLDWYTRKVVGYEVGHRSRGKDWQEALAMGIGEARSRGIDLNGLKLICDNGSQPTSKEFRRFCKEMGIKVIYTTYSNPKGNANTERFMRTLKEGIGYLDGIRGLEELRELIRRFIDTYNWDYPHSAIGNMPPGLYEQICLGLNEPESVKENLLAVSF